MTNHTTNNSMRRSLGTTVGLAMLSVGLLAGCTPVAGTATSDTGGTTAATAAPTPTATAAAFGSPNGVTCDDLAPLASVRAASANSNQATPAQLEFGNKTPELRDIALPLAGGLDCLWQDSTSDNFMTVKLLPNASSALNAAKSTLATTNDATDSHHAKNVPTYGDESWSACVGSATSTFDPCDINIGVGNYWIDVTFYRGDGKSNYPESAARQALVTGVVTAVKALPASPATWKPATASSPASSSCASVTTAAVLKSTLGISGGKAVGSDQFLFAPIDLAAYAAAGVTSCWWGDPSGATTVSYVYAPGGSTVWSQTDGPPAASGSGLVPVAGIGDAAWQVCTNEEGFGECEGYFLVGSDWIELLYGSGTKATTTQFDAFAKAVVAAVK